MTLSVALEADVSSLSGASKGWVGWGINSKAPGTMVGTEAIFVRYVTAGPAVDAVIYSLNGWATSSFTTPTSSIYSAVELSLQPNAVLHALFIVDLSLTPSFTSSIISYAAGKYAGGGLSGMSVHIVAPPPKMCVNMAGAGPILCGLCV